MRLMVCELKSRKGDESEGSETSLAFAVYEFLPSGKPGRSFLISDVFTDHLYLQTYWEDICQRRGSREPLMIEGAPETIFDATPGDEIRQVRYSYLVDALEKELDAP